MNEMNFTKTYPIVPIKWMKWTLQIHIYPYQMTHNNDLWIFFHTYLLSFSGGFLLQFWKWDASLLIPLTTTSKCQNLHWKLGQQSAICWNSLGLFRDYSLNHIFFRNKTFFVFQDKKLKFSASVWKAHKISTHWDNQ